MKKSFYPVLLFLIFVLAGCGDSGSTDTVWISGNPKPTPTPTQEIRNLEGAVTTEEGDPIADVTVTLESMAKDLRFTMTDEEGQYLFENVAPGNYRLTFLKAGSGFENVAKDIVFPDEHNVVLSLKTSLYNESFGGSRADSIQQVIETREGNLIFVGTTNSYYEDEEKSDIPIYKTGTDSDLWVIKIDPRAENKQDSILFNQCYGGSSPDVGCSIIEAENNTVVIAAIASSSHSSTNDIPPGKTGTDMDIWLLKLDLSENTKENSILFNQCYGGDKTDEVYDFVQLNDTTFALAGSTVSAPGTGDIKSRPDTSDRYTDLWVLAVDISKTEDKGIVFNQCYGGSVIDKMHTLTSIDENTVAMTGYTCSPATDPDIPDSRYDATSKYDIWVLKLDLSKKLKADTILFNQCYGGNDDDKAFGMVQLSKDVFAIAATTFSTVGDDVPGSRTTAASDAWILKLNLSQDDKATSLLFSECYGGNDGASAGYDIVETFDGNLAVCALTKAASGDVPADRYGVFWIFKLAPNAAGKTGSLLESWCYGGELISDYDQPSSDEHREPVLLETKDGCLVMGGQINSPYEPNNPRSDIPASKYQKGVAKIWLLKLNNDGDYSL